jgi:stage II sporulation protein D
MTSLPRLAFILIVLLVCFPAIGRADQTYNPIIKIKLAKFFPIATQVVNITSPAAFSITDQNGLSIVQAPASSVYTFTNKPGSRVVVSAATSGQDPEYTEAGTNLSGLLFTIHSSIGSFISISNPTVSAAAHHYRGDIQVIAGLSVVNSLPLEDYLRGVLKPEIGGGAPVEALKAQAVASRTYTIRNMGKMFLSGADMDDTTRTQSYLGEDGETPAIDQAVDDTAGEVLLYDGALINALFCTDCGGMTGVGTTTEPYLSPVADSECADEAPWAIDLSDEQANALFGAVPGVIDGDINLKVTQTDSSGRATQVKVVQGSHERIISGNDLRKMVGYDKLKSTLFKINRANNGSFHIVGQGWGHGLGLCQHGAVYLAQHSCLYADILRHYYTGAVLAPLSQDMIAIPPVDPVLTQSPISSIPPGP